MSEHQGGPAFILYAGVMALWSCLSSAVSAYGLREPFLNRHPIAKWHRRDAVLVPLATAAIFLISAGLMAAQWRALARDLLIAIVPISMLFGRLAERGEVS